MHETGVLAAIFPEMERIECLVIRDFYHRYTVDEHTLVTMQNLRNLPAGYSELLAEVKQPSVVMFALLFHDVGKGVPGEGPVDASVRLARDAMARIRMPSADRETALFLIRKHLELSQVMQSRDLFDPQTIRDVAHQMETVERLKALTLVTYADISAVNPERHDAVARRAVVAALPGGLQRADSRVGNGAHRSHPLRPARARRIPGRLSHALPADPH